MDDFEIAEELGKGNYGTVKKVLHSPTGVVMALKVCRRGFFFFFFFWAGEGAGDSGFGSEDGKSSKGKVGRRERGSEVEWRGGKGGERGKREWDRKEGRGEERR